MNNLIQNLQERLKKANIMNKNQIIENIANKHIIEDIIKNICGTITEDLKDLIQDIYMDLFNKEEKLLIKLYKDKQIKFYLTKIIINNIFSKTSRYYTIYKKPNINKINIDEINYDKY